jgi:hypothetical protein
MKASMVRWLCVSLTAATLLMGCDDDDSPARDAAVADAAGTAGASGGAGGAGGAAGRDAATADTAVRDAATADTAPRDAATADAAVPADAAPGPDAAAPVDAVAPADVAAPTDAQAPADAAADAMAADDGAAPLPVDAAPPVMPTAAPWTIVDIGMASLPGSLEQITTVNEGSAFRLSSTGSDIGGMADAFTFAYQRLAGDGEIVVRVRSFAMADANSKGGAMIRTSLDANAPNVFIGVHGDGTTGRLQYRTATDGMTVAPMMGNPQIATNVYLRLQRRGTTISAARSTNLVTWFSIQDVVLPGATGEVFVGLAAESHNMLMAATAEFDSAHLSGLPTWRHDDIGTVGGSALLDSAGKIALTGWGQPWTAGNGTETGRDFFTFLWRQAAQRDTAIEAHLESVQNVDANARALLMVREGTAAEVVSRNAPNVAVSYTADGRLLMSYRGATGGTMQAASQTGVALPVWVRLARMGNDFVAFHSPDRVNWRQLGSVTLAFSENPAYGLGAASFTPAALATAVFSDPSVGPSPVTITVDAGVPDAGEVDGGSADAGDAVDAGNGADAADAM